MIYCVWYPSGGFGHFINAILTVYGVNFVRPQNTPEFSKTGDSHKLDLVSPKYLHECWPGGIEFRSDKNYCVLIDNGIHNESEKFKSVLPNSTVIKICYTDYSWPIVAKAMIKKAMFSSIEEQLPVNIWETTEPWAKREKYFLFLRDHHFRHAWRQGDETAIFVDSMIEDYDEFAQEINSIVETEYFGDFWYNWTIANAEYIDSAKNAQNILNWAQMGWAEDLSHITDVWTQAVVYYYIWLKYNFEVPHNDYSNWFTNTDDIVKMLKQHGIT